MERRMALPGESVPGGRRSAEADLPDKAACARGYDGAAPDDDAVAAGAETRAEGARAGAEAEDAGSAQGGAGAGGDFPDNVRPFPVAEPASLGADLRRARERAGLSIADVADRTKVRPGILASIEADAHDRLPAMTYTLGFVKAYARTVGLDPAEAAERYRRESRRSDPEPTLVDIEPLDARRMPGRGLVMASVATGLLGIGLLVAWGAGAFDPPAPPPPSGSAAPPALAEPAPPPPAPAAPAPADGPVRLAAREDVWIRVQEGPRGERLFEGTLKKGEALDIPPGRPWVLRAGRAGALEVTIGGAPLPPLGGPGEVLAAQSLLPEDLRARVGEGRPADAAGEPGEAG